MAGLLGVVNDDCLASGAIAGAGAVAGARVSLGARLDGGVLVIGSGADEDVGLGVDACAICEGGGDGLGALHTCVLLISAPSSQDVDTPHNSTMQQVYNGISQQHSSVKNRIKKEWSCSGSAQ